MTVAVGAIGAGAAFVHRHRHRMADPTRAGRSPISDLTFTDATHGFLVWGGPPWSEAAVFRTSDAGATWTPIT
jgi:hypothetical protein